MKKTLAILAACSLAALSTAAMAQDTEYPFTVTTGIDYSSGDYGTGVDTEILVAPVSLRYKTGDLRLTATLPWLRIDGSSAIVGDGSGGVIIDPNAPRTKRSGLGDLTLGAAYAIPEERLGFGLDFSARVKLPTAKRSKGLGTGEVDVTLGTEVSKSFGPVTPFVSASYRMPGDPAGIDLRNTWALSGGASLALGRSVLIASYDYREASTALSDNSQEIFGAFSTPLNDRLGFTLYGSVGLSDGAPDHGVGAMISAKF